MVRDRGLNAKMMRFQHVVLVLVLYLKGSLSQLSVCGHAPLNSRIKDIHNTSEGAWPWQVSLQRSGKHGSHFCGGSLINKDWVLTAAHCFSSGRNSGQVTVYLGQHTYKGYNPNQVVQKVKHVILHPNYNSTTKNNDIALLSLSASVTFSDYIRPVCLAGQGSSVPEGTISWVTGWGRIKSTGGWNNCVSEHIARYFSIRPVSSYSKNYEVDYCKYSCWLDQLNISPVPFPGAMQEAMVPIANAYICDYLLESGSITANMICAGYIQGGPDTCQGDFGGPLVTKLGAAWIQIGVSSWDKGCAQHRSPGVYTLVSQYQIWISSIIKKQLPGFVRY